MSKATELYLPGQATGSNELLFGEPDVTSKTSIDGLPTKNIGTKVAEKSGRGDSRMDKNILDRYNSPEGAESYADKFKRHWTERVNDWNEQRLISNLLRRTLRGSQIALALDLPCGYGRLYPVVKSTADRVVECDWSFHLLKLAREMRNGNTG